MRVEAVPITKLTASPAASISARYFTQTGQEEEQVHLEVRVQQREAQEQRQVQIAVVA